MKQFFPARPRFPGFVALYGFWSIAVLARAIVQYLTRPAPLLPTHLSLLAGCIYFGITLCAWGGAVRLLRVGLWLELVGVLAVSVGERWLPLPYASAWSDYGAGYVWLPLVLPVAGLLMTRQHAAGARTAYNDE